MENETLDFVFLECITYDEILQCMHPLTQDLLRVTAQDDHFSFIMWYLAKIIPAI